MWRRCFSSWLLGGLLLASVAAGEKATGKIEVKRISVPAPTIYKVQRGLSPRKRILEARGQPGLLLQYWQVSHQKSKTQRRLLYTVLMRPPQPTVYRVGMLGSLVSRGGFSRSQGFIARKVLLMRASAYEPGPASCGRYADGYTAIGWPAVYGVAAVDPKVIPMGSLLYVEGYGMAVAVDRGRAIKGKRIDLCFPTRRQAKQFGRRTVRVYLLGSYRGQLPNKDSIATPSSSVVSAPIPGLQKAR